MCCCSATKRCPGNFAIRYPSKQCFWLLTDCMMHQRSCSTETRHVHSPTVEVLLRARRTPPGGAGAGAGGGGRRVTRGAGPLVLHAAAGGAARALPPRRGLPAAADALTGAPITTWRPRPFHSLPRAQNASTSHALSRQISSCAARHCWRSCPPRRRLPARHPIAHSLHLRGLLESTVSSEQPMCLP